MLNDNAVCAVLAEEGTAAIATVGADGPHLTATWQSYIEVIDDQTLVFPAGGLRRTEANVNAGSPVLLLIAARRAESLDRSTGFRLSGSVAFEAETPLHTSLKERFPWCRAAAVMNVTGVERVLG